MTSCRRATRRAAKPLPALPSGAASNTDERAPTTAPDDPATVVAHADLEQVTLGHLEERIAAAAPTPERVAAALQRAAVDVLVLREGRVLGLLPEPGESVPDAADRLLAAIFSPTRHCGGISERDLKLAYMERLAHFKHPRSWTVWTALCADPEPARALVRRLSTALPPPPALPLEATCELDSSPVLDTHARVFETEVAALAAHSTGTELRRYTFFDQHDEAIPRGAFRGTDPAVARAVRGMAIGGVTGVVQGIDGYHVVLLVCRADRRYSRLEDAGVRAELRSLLCRGAADRARRDYVERLARAATVRWDRAALRRVFGGEVLSALPADASRRERPVLP